MGRTLLITGATGFVGGALMRSLPNRDWKVRGSVRQEPKSLAQSDLIAAGELSGATDWRQALLNVHAVVHTAARVHVMRERATDPVGAFRRINVDATLSLAKQAAESQVRRFVFLSSIKVNGDATPIDRPFRADDPPNPGDAYALSKYEAELGLLRIAKETGLEVVIVRPTLIYGPGVKGNFLSMMRWLDKRIPLPFASVHNSRSFLALDNLMDLIDVCLTHPMAANQTFLASDGEDVSTPDLLRRLGKAMGRSPRLFPFPEVALRTLAKMTGQEDRLLRVLGSLRIDIDKTCRALSWNPPLTVDAALRKTARHFTGEKRQNSHKPGADGEGRV